MAYKVGTTTVIDNNGEIDWSRIINAPASDPMASIAAASAGGIGTYVFARSSTASDVAFGATRAGSALQPTSAPHRFAQSGALQQSFLIGTALAGTWRCMGTYDYYARQTQGGGGDQTVYEMYGATLWMRIA
ncbi:MAG: hypothetical protein NXI27_29220 [Alphaproteobacteria bacterium]|nr:hypothetical protein [Alphaproteobacteria bacterium]